MSHPIIAPVAPEQVVRELTAAARVRRAFQFFETRAAEFTDEQARICAIPAPPFGEAERAEYLRAKFQECGLTEARTDGEGNCVALRRGRERRPLLVVSAHLDTVFPPETDFTVRREQGKMFAPGIADDGCGLAALVALARALEECAIETEGSLLFVGTVGEEGEGNLRGVRHLLTRGRWASEIDAFISLDGPGIERITHAALGSRRYRVRFRGAGGHSWGDFGVVNPVHALGRAVARLTAYPAPVNPRTTFNVGRIEGGAGVNVIAREAAMDVDLRSESAEELGRLDAFFRRVAREAADDENAARRAGTPPLELDVKLIGDRPSGETPRDSALVRLAEEATRAFGYRPRFDCSSTDSNIAIAKGLPAVTLGAGGASGNSHTLDEWFDPRGRDLGLKRALLVILGTVSMQSRG
ncbi:MAG TPA: M20/M25/M40 family metallo-hydrolase [Pyrinomonadaceae bacterium]|jgi:acetylornithine deacetylase/succinyl-diaminopimelate desuccinylase-like protein|nr:M20/M25/M40 family metallo-hydrolase [Pyrinomonadaceae bacterium]